MVMERRAIYHCLQPFVQLLQLEDERKFSKIVEYRIEVLLQERVDKCTNQTQSKSSNEPVLLSFQLEFRVL